SERSLADQQRPRTVGGSEPCSSSGGILGFAAGLGGWPRPDLVAASLEPALAVGGFSGPAGGGGRRHRGLVSVSDPLYGLFSTPDRDDPALVGGSQRRYVRRARRIPHLPADPGGLDQELLRSRRRPSEGGSQESANGARTTRAAHLACRGTES